jgi:hypothetical protein
MWIYESQNLTLRGIVIKKGKDKKLEAKNKKKKRKK